MPRDVYEGSSDVLGGGGGGGGAPVKTGTTIAAINAQGTPADGELAVLKVGTWPDRHYARLHWDASVSKWVGEELTVVSQGDTWAMDLGSRTGSQLLDWSYIDNPVPFGKTHAILTAQVDLSSANFNTGTATGVLNVDDTTSPHSQKPFTAAGGGVSGQPSNYAVIRDNFITYTGKTGTTLTGCAVFQGTRGTIPAGEYVTQGDEGGWGFLVNPIPFASAFWSAGLHLQERLTSLMNNAPSNAAIPIGEKTITMAPYWNQYDPGDGSLWPWPPTNIPPSGGMGRSASITSLASSGGALGGERSFYVTENGWTDWPLTTPTKKFLVCRIVGKMESGSIYTGSVLDTMLKVRWVS